LPLLVSSLAYIFPDKREGFARDTAELVIFASYEKLTFVEEASLLENDWNEVDNICGKL
jgi:hypothetical protein